jgi:hypothetical protein
MEPSASLRAVGAGRRWPRRFMRWSARYVALAETLGTSEQLVKRRLDKLTRNGTAPRGRLHRHQRGVRPTLRRLPRGVRRGPRPESGADHGRPRRALAHRDPHDQVVRAQGGLHGPIQAALELRAEYDIDPSSIERVDVAVGDAIHTYGWWKPARPLTPTTQARPAARRAGRAGRAGQQRRDRGQVPAPDGAVPDTGPARRSTERCAWPRRRRRPRPAAGQAADGRARGRVRPRHTRHRCHLLPPVAVRGPPGPDGLWLLVALGLLRASLTVEQLRSGAAYTGTRHRTGSEPTGLSRSRPARNPRRPPCHCAGKNARTTATRASTP